MQVLYGHLDLKPDNVILKVADDLISITDDLISMNGPRSHFKSELIKKFKSGVTVKVIDFGLSRHSTVRSNNLIL